MYKQWILSLLLVIVFCSIADAQLIDRSGLTLSGTYTTLKSLASNPDMKRDYLPGYGMGIFVESDVTKTLSIQANVEFSSRRYEYNSIYEPDRKATHNLYHVSVPVIAKVRSTKFLPNLYGKIGPRFDFFLDSKDEMIVTCSDWECGQIEDKEVMTNSKTMVPGWSVALGSDVGLFGKRMSIEIRYNNDFGTINKDASSEPIRKRSLDVWINLPFSF